MLSVIVAFGAGLFAWTLLEYAIHGWLGHRFRTFVTPIHGKHHRNPHAVFAMRAWVPSAVPLGILYAILGWSAPTIFYSGIICGFVTYEAVHYRVHFASRLTRWESGLRVHHLAHHMAKPERCFGVTTRLWDRVFGTAWKIPDPVRQAIGQVPPLTGPSNLVYRLRFVGEWLRGALQP
jgi:sterol desaturase/sphingolipid hydroxylase (fatty acid hydroxylase superfamily)